MIFCSSILVTIMSLAIIMRTEFRKPEWAIIATRLSLPFARRAVLLGPCAGGLGVGRTCVRRPPPGHDTSSRRRRRRRVVLAPSAGWRCVWYANRESSFESAFHQNTTGFRFPFLSIVGGAKFRKEHLLVLRQDRRSQSVTGSVNHLNLAT